MTKISVSDTELVLSDDEPTDWFLEPLIQRGIVMMIYAPAGVGKTHFVLQLAAAMAGGGQFLAFKAEQYRRGLYVDCELGKSSIKQRWIDVIKFSEFEIPAGSMQFICPDTCGTQICPRISEPSDQRTYDDELVHRDFVILDNYNGLTHRRSRESDEETWYRTELWFRKLKAEGKSVILIHHTGKSGEQLGTSQRTNFVDIQIRLTRPFDYAGGVRFEVNFEKARIDPRVWIPRDYAVTMNFDGARYSWAYQELQSWREIKVRELKATGMQPAQIATALGMSLFAVQKILKGGLWD